MSVIPFGPEVFRIKRAVARQEGAFDEAIKGVDAIIHTASPVDFKVVEDPQGKQSLCRTIGHIRLTGDRGIDLITPAVQGTLGILKSAVKYTIENIRSPLCISDVDIG